MNYQFETDQFRFTSDELQLLRSRFPYRKIKFEEISAIEITKGSGVQRPVLLTVFGLFFIGASLLFVPSTYDAIWFLTNGYVENWEIIDFLELLGLSFIMLGMFFSVGIISLYHALYPVFIMRTTYQNANHHVFSLKKLRKAGLIPNLIRFVKMNFDTGLVKVHDSVLSASN